MGTECEGLQEKSSESKDNYVLQTKETATLELYPYRANKEMMPRVHKFLGRLIFLKLTVYMNTIMGL